MHQGRISVQSEGEGKGSTFRIEVPMTRTSILQPSPSTTLTLQTYTHPHTHQLKNSRTPFTVEDSYESKSGECDHKICNSNSNSKRKVSVSLLRESDLTLDMNSTGTTAGKSIVPKRILVVDDVPTHRKMLRKLLDKRGHYYHSCGDGQNSNNQHTSVEF